MTPEQKRDVLDALRDSASERESFIETIGRNFPDPLRQNTYATASRYRILADQIESGEVAV